MALLKRISVILLRISISIALLIFLFAQVDRKNLFDILGSSDKGLLLFAFLVFGLGYILCFIRWEMLLRGADIHLPFSRVAISAAGGVFFSLFLPSTIGGDLVRSIDLSLHTKRPQEVVATVLLDRLSGYAGLVTVALFSVGLGWRFVQDSAVLVPVAVITAILGVVAAAIFSRRAYALIRRLLKPLKAARWQGRAGSLFLKLKDSLKELHHEMHVFRHRRKILWYTLGLSVVVQVISPLSYYLIARSLGVRLGLVYFFVYIPVISAIIMLPISIGGLGLRDATTIYFFAKAGMGKGLAFAMSLSSFAFILAYGAISGLIYVFTLHHRRLQYRKPSQLRPQPD